MFFNSANTFHNEEALEREGWSCLATVVAWIVFLHLIRMKLESTKKKCDDKLTSPSDYTVCLEGLPAGTFNREDIEQLLTNLWKNFKGKIGNKMEIPAQLSDISVKKIVYAYSIGKYVKKIRRKAKLQAKRRKIISEFHTFKRKKTVNFQKMMTKRQTLAGKNKDFEGISEIGLNKPADEESENTEEILYLSSLNSPTVRSSGIDSRTREPFKNKLDLIDQQLLKLLSELKELETHITEDKTKSLCRMVFVSLGQQARKLNIIKKKAMFLIKNI